MNICVIFLEDQSDSNPSGRVGLEQYPRERLKTFVALLYILLGEFLATLPLLEIKISIFFCIIIFLIHTNYSFRFCETAN